MIGYGLGYLTDALKSLDVYNVIVWEPFEGIYRQAKVSDTDYPIAFNPTAFEDLIDQSAVKGSKPLLEIHPGYEPYVQFEHRFALNKLSSIYLPRNIPSDYILSERAIDSLRRLPHLHTLSELEGHFTEMTAVHISPGPSLKKVIDGIKKRPDLLKFSSIQALPTFRKKGSMSTLLLWLTLTTFRHLLSTANIPLTTR